MKPLACFLLLIAPFARADQDAGRKAIQDIIAELNEPRDSAAARPVASLFTSDAPGVEVERLARLVDAINDARHPWMELDSPHIRCRAIRFVTGDVALADCNVSAGFVPMLRGAPLLFVMKREAAGWRIASFREFR